MSIAQFNIYVLH